MTISIDRSICRDLNEAITREWLVTNGLGGYAAGTVAGVLTRKQHGLLVAMTPQTEVPFLMLAKIDEEVHFDQRVYYLGTNEYQDGTISPAGFVHLEAFSLEDGFPVFTYRLGGVDGLFLEKRIWMAWGQNTTFVQYRVFRTTTTEKPGYRRSGITGMLSSLERYPETLAPLLATQQSLTLTLLPMAAYRPAHHSQHGNLETHYTIEAHRVEERAVTGTEQMTAFALPIGAAGCSVRASDSARPYHILALGHPDSATSFVPTGVWYWHFLHRQDRAAGTPATDDFYLPGIIRTTLWPDDDSTFTLIVSSEDLGQLPLKRERLADMQRESRARQRGLAHITTQPARFFGEGGEAMTAHNVRVLPFPNAADPYEGGREFLTHLLQAADHFVIRRRQAPAYAMPGSPTPYRMSHTASSSLRTHDEFPVLVLADYFSMTNRTRDTLIALPGLLLVPGRHEEALAILRGLTRYFLGGQLPDRLPTREQPLLDGDYGSADTTLWYFYALDYYLRTTRHYSFLEEVFHHLREAINRYVHGTYNGVYVDPGDGLLCASRAGRALTWMDACVNGEPVTARAGKPVELNALWYHALSLIYEWSQHLSHMGLFGHSPAYYRQLLDRCEESFQRRYWYAAGGYLYDVIDGPQGDDAALRPNQLFALSLRYPVLRIERRQQVMEVVTQHLLTSSGLRTLSPQDPAYRGTLSARQDREARLCALHQGSVWPWLVGPYIDALLALRSQPADDRDPLLFQEYLWRKGLQLLEPFRERIKLSLLGLCEGVLDGQAPHATAEDGYLLGSAISVGELLRSYHMLAQLRAIEPQHVYSH